MMTVPSHGFAVMQSPLWLTKGYDTSPWSIAGREWLAQLRKLLPNVKPHQYRGIERFPLNADYEYPVPGYRNESIVKDSGYEVARTRLAAILGLDDTILPNEDWLIDGPWLVPDLKTAKELHTLLGKQSSYEIIEVAKCPQKTKGLLGFDVGYWASGNFSLICDTGIWPLWHPPDLAVKDQLMFHFSHLNEHQLFVSADAALAFLIWYRAQSWSETDDESKPFEIIAVGCP